MKFIIAVASTCLSHGFLSAQTIFSTTLDNTGYPFDADRAEKAAGTQDGGVLVAGRVYNSSGDSSAALAIKLDGNGNPQWWYGLVKDKTTGINKKKVQLYGVTQDAAGNCLFGGLVTVKNYDKVGSTGLLAKFSLSGSLLWYKSYTINASHKPGMKISDVAQLPNGKYVATGYIGNGWSSDNGSCLWFQTDADGQNPTAKGFYIVKNIQGIRIIPQPDNSSVIAWYGRHIFPDIGSVYFPGIIRVDASGNMTAMHWIILDYSAIVNDFIPTSDGGYVAVGNGAAEAYLLKLDGSLNVEWIKSWPIASEDATVPSLNSVKELSNGNFYISGASYQGASSYQNIIVITDPNGNIVSGRLVNASGNNADKIQQSVVLPDGRIMSVGNVSISASNSDISVFHDSPSGVTACPATALNLIPTSSGVLKVKDEDLENGSSWSFTPAAETPLVNTSYQQNTLCSPLKLEAEAAADVFSVFPNPAEEWITLSMSSEKSNASFECDILNITGKVMMHATISGENTTVNVKDLPAGIYTCRLTANDPPVVIARFVKQ